MPPAADVLARWPAICRHPDASAWLRLQADLGLAPRTIEAYGRALDEYLVTCTDEGIEPSRATRRDVARYVHELATRPHRLGPNVVAVDSGVGLANATLRLRLVAVRLFHDYLVEEGVRADNPVGRGRYTAGKGFGGTRHRGMIPRFTKLPWIPTDDQWRVILDASRGEGARNRFMFALAYDAGLRREEICSLRTDDIDPAHRTVRVRAETTKGRRQRVVPYSAACGSLFQEYLAHRRTLSTARGPLFLSESHRNVGRPITLWTWSKVIRAIAVRADVPRFSTHTLRHLCLTDLARSGWELHAIATFAGHRNTDTTLQYIHLSGRDLAQRLEAGMASIHAWRTQLTVDVIS
ncbi:MAG: tyrosine-type recombinase/integrase [Candidatus Dormibacteraeota bacterium]|uniref:Integrase n=1 Tax=Candidatus Aeolococcus gillhamiae TaxID=3127015 RepID=A0A2W5Z2Y7_9BACT|nr:tyrosine-type recombinase/integrase [Candidatus Dormibacteraeota bacterium]PZR79590.1 MAG: integrase [Candidatus Dormibacter sp. RRmetagenome_bin12]